MGSKVTLFHDAISLKCVGCGYATINNECEIWAVPIAKHRLPNGCPSQTNKPVFNIKAGKKVNPIKASKRA